MKKGKFLFISFFFSSKLDIVFQYLTAQGRTIWRMHFYQYRTLIKYASERIGEF